MEQANKKNLILPITILLASIIFSGFYYASQVNKQKSIEKQQEIKNEKKRNEEDAKKECANWALNKAKTSESDYDQEAYDDYFLRCLREKGL